MLPGSALRHSLSRPSPHTHHQPTNQKMQPSTVVLYTAATAFALTSGTSLPPLSTCKPALTTQFRQPVRTPDPSRTHHRKFPRTHADGVECSVCANRHHSQTRLGSTTNAATTPTSARTSSGRKSGSARRRRRGRRRRVRRSAMSCVMLLSRHRPRGSRLMWRRRRRSLCRRLRGGRRCAVLVS